MPFYQVLPQRTILTTTAEARAFLFPPKVAHCKDSPLQPRHGSLRFCLSRPRVCYSEFESVAEGPCAAFLMISRSSQP